ncbi:MAG: exodeoxyribonuclease VII large subunit [Bacillota bacterium]|nr:exodeoxyribonuclease VII large subunit [Bacillota bacterium]
MIKTLKVSDVNNYIKKLFDTDYILRKVKVMGEVSNFKLHSSGHMYFSLKDEESKINCIMFRGNTAKLNFIPEDGMNIIVSGRVSLYVKDGTYQLYAEDIELFGEGELFKAYIKLKEKLQEEGLFSEKVKKRLPLYPEKVGVITSPTGAAVRDIINVIRKRNSSVKILIYPALVQGAGASASIIDGIRGLNLREDIDVIILARGGGSIEELFSFNDENLAREIYKSKIPIITGIGHETDFTIADFVSDIRASTPSHAAEIAVFREDELYLKINTIKADLTDKINNRIWLQRNILDSILNRLNILSPENKIAGEYLALDRLKDILVLKINNIIDKNKDKLYSLNQLLENKNPLNILKRGYSVIRDTDGIVVDTIENLNHKNKVKINMKDGEGLFSIKKVT